MVAVQIALIALVACGLVVGLHWLAAYLERVSDLRSSFELSRVENGLSCAEIARLRGALARCTIRGEPSFYLIRRDGRYLHREGAGFTVHRFAAWSGDEQEAIELEASWPRSRKVPVRSRIVPRVG